MAPCSFDRRVITAKMLTPPDGSFERSVWIRLTSFMIAPRPGLTRPCLRPSSMDGLVSLPFFFAPLRGASRHDREKPDSFFTNPAGQDGSQPAAPLSRRQAAIQS